MLLLLTVDLSAPLIVMPEHSGSLAALELDLGSARIRNRISWTAPQEEGAQNADIAVSGGGGRKVLTDELGVNLHDMGAVAVTATGQRGSNLVQVTKRIQT